MSSKVLSGARGMTLNRPTMNAVARDQFNVQLLTSPRPRPRTPSTSDDEYEDTSSTLLKAAHRLRKGHKTPLSANFRNMKFEDLYLMGSPFPSPDTTAEDYNWGDDSNDLRVTRSMYSARVMSSPIQMDFTALLYEGPAAHETWSQDFNSYAKARHPNVLQLFGVIDQGPIPALIFFSDLIPLGLFIHQCSPIALCYLQLRWIIDRGQAFRYLNRPVLDEELWMQTQSGLLCAGPIGPCVEHPDALKVMEECHYSIVQTWNPQLPSEYYGDEGAVVHYIERHLKDFHKFVGQYRTNPTNTTWDSIRSSPFDTYSLGSVFDASTGDQVALMELSPNWSYDVRSWNAHVIKVWDCEYSSVISEEGWTRFSFSSYIPFGPFEITYTLAVAENFAATLRAAWLAQARYTANERCINPCNFVLLDHICFTLTFIFDYDITLRERPLYLFVAPMILGADDGQYGLSSLNQLSITPMPLMSYWSFDPRGQVSRIRDDKATLTKLPNHTLSISGGSQWKTYQYEAIQQYQRLIPCDFNSRSYAEIHGLPKVHILWPPHEQDIDEITFTESPQPEISLLDFTELRKELQDIGESPETGDDRKETDESQETTESWSSYSPPTSSPDTLDVADASPAVPRKIPIIHLEEIDGKNADDHQQLLGELVQDATSSLMQEIDILQTTSELENPFDEVPSPLSTGLRDFDDVEQSWSIL